MSREQRRMDRRQQRGAAATGAGGPPPPSRRTPVKVAGGSRLPTMPLAIGGFVLVLIGLIAYLIWQANSGGGGLSAPDKARLDRSTSIPGLYVEDQGRGHFTGGLNGHVTQPFCDGVEQSDLAKQRSGQAFGTLSTPGANSTGTTTAPTATSTPLASPTSGSGTAQSSGTADANATPTVPTGCHLSNPPSSGQHLNVQHNVDVGNGVLVNIPPDPDVYPDDVEIPRDGIAHIEEHAGVFIGWNCADGDQACTGVVDQLKSVVNDRIDNHSDRAVMAHDLDLPLGTIGLASWTRVLDFATTDWDANKSKASDFIGTNSCRFDPEGFCH